MISEARDALDAAMATYDAAVSDRLKADAEAYDRVVAERDAARAIATCGELLFADELGSVPQPHTAWNVDAPAGSLSVGEGALRTTIRFDQPLNGQGKCKTEVGPRDTSKTTASYRRLPLGVPLRAEVDLHVPETWLRYDHKFAVLEFYATGASRGTLSLNLVGDRVFLWRTPGEVWTAQRWAGWSRLQFDLTLSEDPAVARTEFRLDGVAKFVETGFPNAKGDAYLKFGMYCPSWNSPDRDSIKAPAVRQQHVHWRRFRLWRI